MSLFLGQVSPVERRRSRLCGGAPRAVNPWRPPAWSGPWGRPRPLRWPARSGATRPAGRTPGRWCRARPASAGTRRCTATSPGCRAPRIPARSLSAAPLAPSGRISPHCHRSCHPVL